MTTLNSQLSVFKGGWEELENAVFTDNDTPVTITGGPTFFIKPDGAQLFIINSGIVETHPLSVPWDVDTFGATGNTFTITDDATPTGLFFKDDGTKMFVVGQTTKTIYEYVLVIPWDVSSIVASPVSLSLIAVTGSVVQCAFSRDGDFFYITDGVSVNGFPLPTPWDVTSNVIFVSFTPASGDDVDSVTFKREGDKMYLGSIVSPTTLVTEYDLTVPYNVSIVTPTGNTFDPGIDPVDIFFKPTGLEFFAISTTIIRKYHLDDAWDISTASRFGNTFSILDNLGITWKPDGTKFMIMEVAGVDEIREFSVPNPWNLTGATQTGIFSIEAITTVPNGMDWNLEGTICTIADNGTDTVIQLNCSTGWDLSTMTDPGISVDITDNRLSTGIVWTRDRKRFYICDRQSTLRRISQYDLSIADDLTTATFTSRFSFINAFASPFDLSLHPNNKFIYMADAANERIIQFTLPDLIEDVAEFDELDISPFETAVLAMDIRKTDGEKLYFSGSSSDQITAMDMSLEFNNTLITEFGDELVTDTGDFLVHA